MTKRTLSKHQAEDILRALSAWLRAEPGRRLTVAFEPEAGWRASMNRTATAGGESLADTLAQLAQVAALDE